MQYGCWEHGLVTMARDGTRAEALCTTVMRARRLMIGVLRSPEPGHSRRPLEWWVCASPSAMDECIVCFAQLHRGIGPFLVVTSSRWQRQGLDRGLNDVART